eukprot:gene7899-8752_t
MPRLFNKAKLKDKRWSEDALKMALEQRIQNNRVSIRKLSEMYKIPKSTLACYIKGKRIIGMRTGSPVLLPEEEDIIVEWLKVMAQNGYPRSGTQTCLLAKHVLDSRKRTTVFQDNLPKKDWFGAFLRRHQCLEASRLRDVSNAKTVKNDGYVFEELCNIHLEFCGTWGIFLPEEIDSKHMAPARGSVFVAIENGDIEMDAREVNEIVDVFDEDACLGIDSVISLNRQNEHSYCTTSEENIGRNDNSSQDMVNSVIVENMPMIDNQTDVNTRSNRQSKTTVNRKGSGGEKDQLSIEELKKRLQLLETIIPREKLVLFENLRNATKDPLFDSWNMLKDKIFQQENNL